MRAAKRRLEQDIATPGLSLLLAAYYDPAGGFAGATFDTPGANPRNEITRDDLLAVAVLDVRWRPAAVRRLLGADSRKATDLLVGISSLTDLWLAQRSETGGHRTAAGAADEPPGRHRRDHGEQAAGAQAPAACPCSPAGSSSRRPGSGDRRGRRCGTASRTDRSAARLRCSAAGSGRRQYDAASRRRVVDAAQSVQGCHEGP